MYYLLAIILFSIGFILNMFTPAKNKTIGYKTHLAMKNNDTWNKANKCFGFSLQIGSIIFTISFFLINNLTTDVYLAKKIYNLSLLIIVIFCIIYTEFQLRKIFDNNGNRKKL